jgi:hypothetical protein
LVANSLKPFKAPLKPFKALQEHPFRITHLCDCVELPANPFDPSIKTFLPRSAGPANIFDPQSPFSFRENDEDRDGVQSIDVILLL